MGDRRAYFLRIKTELKRLRKRRDTINEVIDLYSQAWLNWVNKGILPPNCTDPDILWEVYSDSVTTYASELNTIETELKRLRKLERGE